MQLPVFPDAPVTRIIERLPSNTLEVFDEFDDGMLICFKMVLVRSRIFSNNIVVPAALLVLAAKGILFREIDDKFRFEGDDASTLLNTLMLEANAIVFEGMDAPFVAIIVFSMLLTVGATGRGTPVINGRIANRRVYVYIAASSDTCGVEIRGCNRLILI